MIFLSYFQIIPLLNFIFFNIFMKFFFQIVVDKYWYNVFYFNHFNQEFTCHLFLVTSNLFY